MKFGIAFVLSFVHVITLSVVASEIAQDNDWNAVGVCLAWIVGAVLGLFPIIRSIAVVALCFIGLPWIKALWVAPLAVLVLAVVEKTGTVMMKKESGAPRGDASEI